MNDDPRLWGAAKQQFGMGWDFHLEGGGGNDIFITGGGFDSIIVDFSDDDLEDHDIDPRSGFRRRHGNFQIFDAAGAAVRVGMGEALEISEQDLTDFTTTPLPPGDGIYVDDITGAMDGFGDGSYVRLLIQLGGARQTLHLYDFHDDDATTALTAADITDADFFTLPPESWRFGESCGLCVPDGGGEASRHVVFLRRSLNSRLTRSGLAFP